MIRRHNPDSDGMRKLKWFNFIFGLYIGENVLFTVNANKLPALQQTAVALMLINQRGTDVIGSWAMGWCLNKY